MTPAAPPTTAPPADDPVAALADPHLLERLRRQAAAVLDRLLADLPAARRAEEADELLQSAVARLCEKRGGFDPSRGDFGAWAHGLLMHVASEHCRRLRKLPPQLPGTADPPAAADPDDPDFDPAALPALLDFLGPDDRTAVEGFHLLGLSHRQIAARLGTTEGTARARLRRALLKLQRHAREVSR